MVELSLQLNTIFHSLSDPIRRDILLHVSLREFSIGELVEKYDISFAAVAKHVNVLEKARLIHKHKEGRKSMVGLNADTLKEADEYLAQYRRMWEGRYSKLDSLLKEKE